MHRHVIAVLAATVAATAGAEVVDPLDNPQAWTDTAVDGSEVRLTAARDGDRACLRVDYEFPPVDHTYQHRSAFVAVERDVEVNVHDPVFAFSWRTTRKTEHMLFFRICDAQGQAFDGPPICLRPADGWRTAQIVSSEMKAVGAQDRPLQLPLRRVGFIVQQSRSVYLASRHYCTEGDVLLDDLQVTSDAQACARDLRFTGEVLAERRERGTVNRREVPLKIGSLEPLEGSCWVRGGVPLPEGEVCDAARTCLFAADRELGRDVRVLSRWPDGSIQSLLIGFIAQPDMTDLTLIYGHGVAAAMKGRELAVREDDQGVLVDTGPLRFLISRHGFRLFDRLWADLNGDGKCGDEELLLEASDDIGAFGPDGALSGRVPPRFLEVEHRGYRSCVIRVAGAMRTPANAEPTEYVCRIYAYAERPEVQVAFTFINSSGELMMPPPLVGLRIPAPEGSLRLEAVPDAFPVGEGIRLDAWGEYLPDEQRYAYPWELRRGGQILAAGEKLGGWLDLMGERWGLGFALDRAWQNHPKALEMSPGRLSVELSLPRGEGDERRFYQGMAKTHRMMLCFDPDPEARARSLRDFLRRPLLVASPAWYAETKAFGEFLPFDPQKEDFPHCEQVAESYCHHLYDTQRTFRDEYGMIDFGDYHHGDGPITWHNLETAVGQGVLMRYLRTGDRRYLTWASEAIGHYADIDTCHAPGSDLLYRFDAIYGPLERTVAYAATYVHAPREMDVTIELGSDDGSKVWVNDQPLASRDEQRSAAPGQDSVAAHLKAGPNLVLLKVSNYVGDWSFYWRIKDADGGAAPVTYSNPLDAEARPSTAPTWACLGPLPADPAQGAVGRSHPAEEKVDFAASYEGVDGKVGWVRAEGLARDDEVGGIYWHLPWHCARDDGEKVRAGPGGHDWYVGLCRLHMLTGDEWLAECARLHADNTVANLAGTMSDPYLARDFSWPAKNLIATYTITGEQKYLANAARVMNYVRFWREAIGSPRIGNGYQNTIPISALRDYYLATRDLRARELFVELVDLHLADLEWEPGDELPLECRHHHDHRASSLMEILPDAYRWTGDERYIREFVPFCFFWLEFCSPDPTQMWSCPLFMGAMREIGLREPPIIKPMPLDTTYDKIGVVQEMEDQEFTVTVLRLEPFRMGSISHPHPSNEGRVESVLKQKVFSELRVLDPDGEVVAERTVEQFGSRKHILTVPRDGKVGLYRLEGTVEGELAAQLSFTCSLGNEAVPVEGTAFSLLSTYYLYVPEGTRRLRVGLHSRKGGRRGGGRLFDARGQLVEQVAWDTEHCDAWYWLEAEVPAGGEGVWRVERANTCRHSPLKLEGIPPYISADPARCLRLPAIEAGAE